MKEELIQLDSGMHQITRNILKPKTITFEVVLIKP